MRKRQQLPDSMDWALLHTFRLIVEENSISRAALRLRLTQSAVSHGLKRLETQIGARLVERGYRSLRLTEQGQMLYESASHIFHELIRLDNSLNRDENSITGTLHLLVISRIVSDTFDEYLRRFRQGFPSVKVHIEVLPSADILQQVSQNLAVLGFALPNKEIKNIRRVLIIPERYSLYCGRHHPLYAKKRIDKEDLLSQNFVSFFSEQWGDALSPLAVFRDVQEFRGEVIASSNNFDEIKRLLFAGYGIGCLPDNTVEQEVREGLLRRIPLANNIADIPIYLVWSLQRKLKPVERAFITGLFEAFNIHGEKLP